MSKIKDQALVDALIEQFNFEIESGFIYFAMGIYTDREGMDGFTHFLELQAQEEFEHAEKFYHFLDEMDVKIEFNGIEKPKADYESFLDVFQTALDHEREVTKRIKDIYVKAQEVGCLDTQEFLNWFLMEQREEEQTFEDIVLRLERINGNWGGLYIFDGQLAQREN